MCCQPRVFGTFCAKFGVAKARTPIQSSARRRVYLQRAWRKTIRCRTETSAQRGCRWWNSLSAMDTVWLSQSPHRRSMQCFDWPPVTLPRRTSSIGCVHASSKRSEFRHRRVRASKGADKPIAISTIKRASARAKASSLSLSCCRLLSATRSARRWRWTGCRWCRR